MRPRTVVLALLVPIVVFAAITLIALEGHEVAVLRTRAGDGTVRETRVWIAEEDGVWWVESATPERDFYRDLLARPDLEVVRDGTTVAAVAVPEPGAAGHERIRALLRSRYGWADHWVGLLQDTSRSVAVRLLPRPTGADAAGE